MLPTRLVETTLTESRKGNSRSAKRALYLSSLNSMVNKAASGPKRVIDASLDRRAPLIARMAKTFGGDGFRIFFGPPFAEHGRHGMPLRAIADKLTAIAVNTDLPDMAEKRRKAAENKQQIIAAGETLIRDWALHP